MIDDDPDDAWFGPDDDPADLRGWNTPEEDASLDAYSEAIALEREEEHRRDVLERLGLINAYDRNKQPPRLEPMFPVGGEFTPQSQCPHGGPIKKGSIFVCMVCHKSGVDGHPALKRDLKTDPRPDPKPPAPPPLGAKVGTKRTRKQKREAAYKVALTDHLTEKAA